MNRAQLKLAIMAWLHRASFRTPVADPFDATAGFIALAEEQINAKLRARCMVARVSEPVTGQYLTLPCDYLEHLDARIQNGPPLIDIPRADAAGALWRHAMSTNNDGLPAEGLYPDYTPIINPPDWPWNNGLPQGFTIVGNEMEFSPFPEWDPASGTPEPVWPVCELAYYQRQNLGPDDTDTNIVLTTYPGVYIFGSLVEAAPFIRDDGRVKLWQDKFNDAVAGANAEHERARTAGGQLRQRFKRLA